MHALHIRSHLIIILQFNVSFILPPLKSKNVARKHISDPPCAPLYHGNNNAYLTCRSLWGVTKKKWVKGPNPAPGLIDALWNANWTPDPLEANGDRENPGHCVHSALGIRAASRQGPLALHFLCQLVRSSLGFWPFRTSLCVSHFFNSWCLVQGLGFRILTHIYWMNDQEAENMHIQTQCLLEMMFLFLASGFWLLGLEALLVDSWSD